MEVVDIPIKPHFFSYRVIPLTVNNHPQKSQQIKVHEKYFLPVLRSKFQKQNKNHYW